MAKAQRQLSATIVAGFLVALLSGAAVLRASAAASLSPVSTVNPTNVRDVTNRPIAEYRNQETLPQDSDEPSYVRPAETTIDTSRLEVREKKEWDEVIRIVNLQDSTGTYVNPQLHRVYERLNGGRAQTFFIENHCFEKDSGTLATTNITKVKGETDFSEMVIQLDFNKVRELSRTTKASMVRGFKEYEGLIGNTEGKPALRLAELFGHEAAHVVWHLDHPSDAVALYLAMKARDAALAALPKNAKYPYPPDVMQKMIDVANRLIPTEKAAQQAEKAVNSELRAAFNSKQYP